VTRADAITEKLTAGLAPLHLEVENESAMHNVPKGSETHFRVLVVSPAFDGLGPIDRHRRVHDLLRAELAAGLHALTLKLLTPEQWEAGAGPVASPKCLGGSKA
jgi:BolA-like protein 1